MDEKKVKLKKLFPNNRFAKSVSVLAGGTAAGQLIVILASPILTRLYSPEDFGLLAVYAGILGILGTIANFRYQLAIPLPESDEEALNLAALSFFALVFLVIVLVIVVGFFGSEIVAVFNIHNFGPYLWLLPVGVALVGFYQILQCWSLREKLFPLIAKTKLVQSSSVAGFQILGAGLGPLALLGGRTLGQAIVNFKLLQGVRPYLPAISGSVNLKTMLSAAISYRQFPLFSSWAGLLNAGGAQVPPLFFAAFFGPAAAGGYMLAQRVINMPLSVIGTAVSDAFLPKSIDSQREGKLGELVVKVFSALAALMFPSAMLIFFVAPELFQFVFGSEWRVAGEIVRWLSPMLAVQFLVNPVSRIFVTVERQDLALFFQSILFVFRAGSLVLAFSLELSLLTAVKMFSFTSAAGYLLYLAAILRVSNAEIVEFFKGVKATVFLSFLIFLICSLFNFVFDDKGGALFLSLAIGGLFVSANILILMKNMRLV